MSSTPERQTKVTQILEKGGADAWKELLPLVYDELRAIASRRMENERKDHTLTATALVNEAYVRLVGNQDIAWSSRRHFFGAAAEAMRRVLVDHARRVRAGKRGGGQARMSLTLVDVPDPRDPERVLALDEALERLATNDARAAEVARLRFYTGLGIAETGRALGISESTVRREWAYARAFLTDAVGDTR